MPIHTTTIGPQAQAHRFGQFLGSLAPFTDVWKPIENTLKNMRPSIQPPQQPPQRPPQQPQPQPQPQQPPQQTPTKTEDRLSSISRRAMELEFENRKRQRDEFEDATRRALEIGKKWSERLENQPTEQSSPAGSNIGTLPSTGDFKLPEFKPRQEPRSALAGEPSYSFEDTPLARKRFNIPPRKPAQSTRGKRLPRARTLKERMERWDKEMDTLINAYIKEQQGSLHVPSW